MLYFLMKGWVLSLLFGSFLNHLLFLGLASCLAWSPAPCLSPWLRVDRRGFVPTVLGLTAVVEKYRVDSCVRKTDVMVWRVTLGSEGKETLAVQILYTVTRFIWRCRRPSCGSRPFHRPPGIVSFPLQPSPAPLPLSHLMLLVSS